nr:staphylocoagulase repeat protein [uncultured Mediterranean phage uvMED]|tara:strand:+ start:29 stop:472 length:444 start_codon:yes stop_codon:yes gene_type:complete
MASVKAVNITNLDATPIVKTDSETNGGKIRVSYDNYEASSLASGSDITIGRIPANATIMDVVLKCDALGGSSTLTVGDSGDADRYLAAVGTWNAAGQTQSMLGGSTAANTAMTGLGYRTTASTDIVITTGGATISGSIHCWVMYTVE